MTDKAKALEFFPDALMVDGSSSLLLAANLSQLLSIIPTHLFGSQRESVMINHHALLNLVWSIGLATILPNALFSVHFIPINSPWHNDGVIVSSSSFVSKGSIVLH
ncbi:MAG TPA: hypothetical protein PLB55_14640 [Prosthecobacter sp.]|jgi:hypothetical protein|nr:hypothetical protein [Prosthecobacter sp.]